MSANSGDHAYACCLAVLGEQEAAERCALEALRRGGGRSRTLALAHARACALAAAADNGPSEANEDVAGLELTGLARLLSLTRPAVERAVADLQTRHGLDGTRFGRALGTSAAEAAALAAEVSETWAEQLDPALLAFLGPGECPELAGVLIGLGLFVEPPAPDPAPMVPVHGAWGAPGAVALTTGPHPVVAERAGPVTVGALLDAAGPVRAHLGECQVCADRRLAMVSVHDLLARVPLERAPIQVQAAAAASAIGYRLRRPPPPAPLRPRAGRWRGRAVMAGAAALLLAVAGGGVALGLHLSRGGSSDRVGALTKLPPVNALSVDGGDTVGVGEIFTLSNSSPHPVRWSAASQVPWLAVLPDHGVVGPGERVDLQTSLLPGAPASRRLATVTISGDDGSAAAVAVGASSGPPPRIDAVISGCSVRATVDAAAGVGAVTLSWRPHGATTSPSASVDMAAAAGGYRATLLPSDQPVDWWVAVTDKAGGRARTPTHLFALGACPPAA